VIHEVEPWWRTTFPVSSTTQLSAFKYFPS
jgi:hypothetical protein